MTDRELKELLEFAARAKGIRFVWGFTDSEEYMTTPVAAFPKDQHTWRPHACDRDAFRLQVALKLDIKYRQGFVCIYNHGVTVEVPEGNDPLAAARLAILHAAAAIGRRLSLV